MLCSTDVGTPDNCTTTIDSDWEQSQDYDVLVTDTYGNTGKADGETLTILKEAFSVSTRSINITLQTEETVSIVVHNTQNRPFTYTLDAISAALCDGTCSGGVDYTLTNQQTGRERTVTVDVTVRTEKEGVASPGVKLLQLVFIALVAAGLFFYFRE